MVGAAAGWMAFLVLGGSAAVVTTRPPLGPDATRPSGGEAESPRLPRRQTKSTGLVPTAGLSDMTTWDTDTAAVCRETLAHLASASNPSGTAVCYNLMKLDTQTGGFMADLRLFQVSTPLDEFAGIPPEKIQVALQYSGASVSPVSMSTIRSRHVAGRSVSPTPLHTYIFAGQIDKGRLGQSMTMGRVESLVLPVVTLKTIDSNGGQVETNVSTNEAVFVNGVFSRDVVLSKTALAQRAVNEQLTGLRNGTVAFVLPGVQILIFPIGLIISSVWTVVGVGIYIFGTVERMAYRDAYRRSKARESKAPVRRI